jgi:predicted ABC-type transport system involved in lysophospholipase L1 biosynthesis ATPase subunit
LRIDPGEFVALVGPSGSGKSTLLQVVAGLDEPSAGSVWVGGMTLSGLDGEARTRVRRERIGIVFQRDNLWNHLTALENVALAAQLTGDPTAFQRAQQLLAELGLENRVHHRPAALSGGEQQRVGIATALINNPVAILADEPSGELDRASEALVLDQLDRARRSRGCALLVVTHSEAIAARATRVVRMEDGTCH